MEQQRNYTAKQFRLNENCWQSDTAHFYYAAAPVGSPPPKPTGGLTAFPDSATKIFVLPQNTLTLAFNATKSQLCNPRIWRRLKRIFAMLAKERKEAKETLWEFLGLEDDGDEVEICAKILTIQRWFEKHFAYFCEKPPPNKASDAWLSAVVPRLCRAPNNAALWRCVGG
jgi:hypothetical protein